ncbi:hypothetical protein KKG31_04220 [Patescibacteria group bacterium]|nr:hypothetical protein [Patescibacteria group bacterium]MBU1758347.1 hypothetical protein [Patescibacteria group bacterium]
MAGSSKVAVKDVAEFSINEDIFKDFGDMDPAKSVFVDMFIIFLTLILLWKLLEWSITFGK